MMQTSAQIVFTQPLPQEMGARFRFWGKPSLAGSGLHKSGGRRVKSWPDDTHKQTHYCYNEFGLCHKQINKQHTSIRFNHTHNTHWVHLKCTQIKQREYKHDWRCTIHTPTQIIRNKIEELKKTSYTAPNQTSSQYNEENTHKNQNTKNTPLHHHVHRQRAQTRKGIITLIKDDITFTNINIPKAINTHTTQNYN